MLPMNVSMVRSALVAACALVMTLSITAPAAAAPPAADLVLRQGALWTGVGTGTRTGSVAMLNGRIVAVGDDADMVAWVGPDTRVILLDGAMVTPGFIDNHVHFSSAARLLLGVNLLAVDSEASLRAAVQAADARVPVGAWLVGGDWSAYQRWPQGAERPLEGDIELFAPQRTMVDDITPDRPMLLSRFDREVWFANGAALAAAGVSRATTDPDGGRFGRDTDGTPNGLLWGSAVEVVRRAMPAPSHAQHVAETHVALQRIRENGVTTVHDISPAYQLRIYQELLARGELTTRVHYRPMITDYRTITDVGITAGFGSPWIRLGAVKGHIDGIMGNSSALFEEPYSHTPDSRGSLRAVMYPEGNLQRLMNEADAAGLQITVHAIGDAANSMLLDMVEEMVATNGSRDRRFRVVHAQVLHPRDIPRFRDLDLIAEVQPFHAIDDMRWMEQRIGDRAQGAYSFKSLLDAGATLSFGSDWPGTNAAWYPISPVLGIYAAVTRKTVNGTPAGGWFPEERIGVEDALRAYTVNNAYAGFEETEKGTLEVGKLADVTVLDRDVLVIPPDEIKDVRVLFTIVDGRVVYAAQEGQ
jgi:predicted amidohydrolase YtcJ